MKILHVSTRESFGGGAASAARRLHLGLLEAHVASRMAVLIKQGDTPEAFELGGKLFRRMLRPMGMRIEDAVRHCYTRPAHAAYASFSFFPSLQHRRLNAIQKDIVHLHSIVEGFLTPWALARLRGPVVWTTHDAWPFTGGCHYWSVPCKRYEASCGRCPLLGSTTEWDLSRWHWHLKRKALQKLRPVIVSPSQDYARRATASGMLQGCRIEIIPNGIDANVFKPIPKAEARHILGLPQDASIVLFGAVSCTSDLNKGYDLLLQALHALPSSERANLLAVVFGASQAEELLPCPTHFLGRLHDDVSLALAYSAADVFVCPSRHEAFSLTSLESLACGTPVVAFGVGGLPDMIDHGITGYLAEPYDPAALASGLSALFANAEMRSRMGEQGRNKVLRKFSLPIVTNQYVTLYKSILDGAPHEC